MNIIPFELKPENPTTNSLPILFVPGWGLTPNAYKDTLELFRQSGRHVISLSYPQDAALLQDKAAAILAVLLEKGISQVDVVAHSEGCLNVLLAADKEPRWFRNFVLVAPPGFTQKESYLKIFDRILNNAIYKIRKYKTYGPINKHRVMLWNLDSQKWIRARGAVRGLFEGMVAGRIEIADTIRELRNTTSGPSHGIVIIVGQEDKMIAVKKLQKAGAESLGVDGLRVISGGHWDIGIKSEEYAPVILDALGLLDKKYS